MNRRKFIQNSLLLTAFASTYQYIKATDIFLNTPNKDLDLFYSNIYEQSQLYLHNKISDFEFREKINESYLTFFKSNDTAELSNNINFSLLKQQIDFKNKGRGRAIVDSPIAFSENNMKIKTQIIGIQKGYAIPPHIHDNMSSISLILSGKMEVSHYNRLKTRKNYVLVEKDSQIIQNVGDWSMVSPIKNNLHWFKSFESDSYMLNVNIEGLNNRKAKPGIRLDLSQKEQSKNVFKGIIISDKEAQEKYGKIK